MEFGDIIYFILLVFFAILGFFNDSRKKKQQKKPETQHQPEVEPRPFFDEERKVIPRQPQARKPKTTLPPPTIPVTYSGSDVHKEFRSSLDLVSIHDEQSSRPGYSYDYDVNSYEKDPDSPDIAEMYHGISEEKGVKGPIHPLIRELREEAGHEELKKGLVYGEIIQRKY